MQTLAIEQLSPAQAGPNIERLRQLGQELTALEAELTALERRQEGWASGLAAAERLLAMFEAEQARLSALDYAEKRAILDWLGVKVTLYPVGSEPRWTMTTSMPLPELLEEVPDDGIEYPDTDGIEASVPRPVYSISTDFEPDEYHPAMADAIAKAASFADTASAPDAWCPGGPPEAAPGPAPPSRPRPDSRDRQER